MKLETYPEPALAVLGLDGVDVAEPVAVPSPESGGVVNTDGVDAAETLSVNGFARNWNEINIPLNLKASPLERTDVVPKGSGSIGTAEDVLV